MEKSSEIEQKFNHAFYNITLFRLFITLLIVGWGVVISYLITRTKDKEKKNDVKYIHKIWFGDTSIFVALIYIWILTILFIFGRSNLPSFRTIYRSLHK